MKSFFLEFRKTLKYSFKVSKSGLIVSIIFGLISGISIFLPLIFSEQIVNSLYLLETNNLGFKDIFIIAIIFIVSISFCLIIKQLLNAYFNYLTFFTYKTTDILLAKRSLTLDYELLEKKENKMMIQKARDGQTSSGGIGSFLVNIKDIIQYLFLLILGLIYISKLFITKEIVISKVPTFLESFAYSWYSGLVIIVAILLALIITIFFLKIMYKISSDLFIKTIDLNRKFQYFFKLSEDYHFGIDARIFNLKEVVLKQMDNVNNGLTKLFSDTAKKTAFYNSLITLTVTLVTSIGYFLITLKAYYKIIEIGEIIIISGSITNVLTSLTSIFSLFEDLAIKSKYLGYFNDYLSLKNKEDKEYEDISKIKSPYVFTFKNVSFKYPNADEYALKNVSFTLGKYNKTAIVGKNGAGKSTIIKLIARFYKPDEGEILVNNININKFKFKEYQNLFAIVFQDFSLFPLTIKENVSGNKEINEDLIKEDLDKVNFDYSKFSKNIDTYIYKYLEDSVELSGGEAQKVAIARALYKDSPYVFLDEPTSALDPLSEAEIYSLFDKLVDNKKAIYISHRMSSTKFCDDIIVLDKGKIIEEGSHEELMKISGGIYQELFNAQAKYYK